MLKKLLIIILVFVAYALIFSANSTKANAAVWPPPSVVDVDPSDPCQAACQAQRLADDLSAQDIALGFPPNHWFVVSNGDGSYTVVCVNGERSLTFRGQPPPPPPPPPPACNQSCVSDQSCLSYNTSDGCTKCIKPQGAANGTCQKPPSCGTPCTQAGECAGAALNCTACVANKCSTPPQCGTPCQQAGDCAGAALNCTACVDNKCAVQPTVTPMPPTATPIPPTATPIPQCGTPCNLSSDCAGASMNCNLCVANKCTAPSPTPIPPTPTPTFNPASCTCDGINYANLATGKNTTITSYAKILGYDAQIGIITGQKFFLTEGANDISGKIVAQSGLMPATPSGGRYESKWTFKLPTLVSGNTYRIWSQITCQPKAAAYTNPAVAGVQIIAEDTSLIGRFIRFIKSIVGIKDNKLTTALPSSTPAPKIASKPTDSEVLGENAQVTSLQMGTINPIVVFQKTCDVIKFRYNF